MLFFASIKMQNVHLCGGAHLPSFFAICVRMTALVHPVHVPNKQRLLRMTIRILVVVATHVKVMELWLLFIVFYQLHFCHFLTVIVVVIFRMILIFHHVIVYVLNVVL
jgi:hypothetical protein